MNQAAADHIDNQESHAVVEKATQMRRLSLIAALLGGFSVLAAFGIGLISYNYAVDVHLQLIGLIFASGIFFPMSMILLYGTFSSVDIASWR
jgi:hypothetical protein